MSWHLAWAGLCFVCAVVSQLDPRIGLTALVAVLALVCLGVARTHRRR